MMMESETTSGLRETETAESEGVGDTSAPSETFWTLCPVAMAKSIVHALYQLNVNFKLFVLSDKDYQTEGFPKKWDLPTMPVALPETAERTRPGFPRHLFRP